MKKFLFKSLSVLTMSALVVSNMPYLPALAQEQAADQSGLKPEESQNAEGQAAVAKNNEIINLVVGDVQIIETKNLSRIAVTNPEIIDISDAKSDKVFVVGKRAGQTEVFVWDDGGKRGITVRVAIEDLNNLKIRMEEILSKAQIKGILIEKSAYEGKIVISGEVSKQNKDLLEKLIEPLSDRIINLVKVEPIDDMIEIDAQILELDTAFDKTLGIDWYTGKATLTPSTVTNTSDGKFFPQFIEVPPSSSDFFKVGKIERATLSSAFSAQVNALINDNKGRVISRPRLTVKSGKEASFLVGGEIPISTTTVSSGGTTTQNSISYKQYGVNMTITPTIKDKNIDITLNVQVSDIDTSTKDLQGNVGFRTSQAQTELFLQDRETIALAGFIKHSDTNNVRKVAFLGNIPVLGSLFRSRSTPTQDTEMVIILTARIIKSRKFVDDQIKMPSKRIENFNSEVENSFERESLLNKPKEVNKAPRTETKTILRPVIMPAVNVSDAVILPYVRNLQMRISQAISYPYEALKNNWEGTVKLRLRILKDGSLADCDLLESSGHDVFDKDALNTAKIVAPFTSFPDEMNRDDLVVTVPIVYNQREVTKDSTQTVVASY